MEFRRSQLVFDLRDVDRLLDRTLDGTVRDHLPRDLQVAVESFVGAIDDDTSFTDEMTKSWARDGWAKTWDRLL